jgi:hypothetical protein
MSADAEQVDTLLQAEHAAEEARRSGDDDLLPAAVRAAYEAGNGVGEIVAATGLPQAAVMEMLALA